MILGRQHLHDGYCRGDLCGGTGTMKRGLGVRFREVSMAIKNRPKAVESKRLWLPVIDPVTTRPHKPNLLGHNLNRLLKRFAFNVVLRG